MSLISSGSTGSNKTQSTSKVVSQRHLFPNAVAPMEVNSGRQSSIRTIQINDILLNHDARQKFADYVKKEKEEVDFAVRKIINYQRMILNNNDFFLSDIESYHG